MRRWMCQTMTITLFVWRGGLRDIADDHMNGTRKIQFIKIIIIIIIVIIATHTQNWPQCDLLLLYSECIHMMTKWNEY